MANLYSSSMQSQIDDPLSASADDLFGSPNKAKHSEQDVLSAGRELLRSSGSFLQDSNAFFADEQHDSGDAFSSFFTAKSPHEAPQHAAQHSASSSFHSSPAFASHNYSPASADGALPMSKSEYTRGGGGGASQFMGMSQSITMSQSDAAYRPYGGYSGAMPVAGKCTLPLLYIVLHALQEHACFSSRALKQCDHTRMCVSLTMPLSAR
jgi:hypothetical protein